RKEDNTAIGRCGFSHFYGVQFDGMDHYYWGSADKVTKDGDIFQLLELGYTYSKQAWGKGYATEAALAFRDYGFNTLRYDEISSLVIKENLASIKVAKKLGATDITDCMVHDSPSFNLTNRK
ncbi:MAG: GNAT family N-acetyltransferase, partial [Kordiimonadaceae bacterium]|nr:GNAT family N-acetyltransferase [Kordiimonadaceae bacterium]